MISFNSYSETLICSSINTTFKNIDPILVTFRFTRDGNIFPRGEFAYADFGIYYEDDNYLILDANFGRIGGTIMFYFDKISKEFIQTNMGVRKFSSNTINKGKCEVVY